MKVDPCARLTQDDVGCRVSRQSTQDFGKFSALTRWLSLFLGERSHDPHHHAPAHLRDVRPSRRAYGDCAVSEALTKRKTPHRRGQVTWVLSLDSRRSRRWAQRNGGIYVEQAQMAPKSAVILIRTRRPALPSRLTRRLSFMRWSAGRRA
jgi:hypothetical protein